MIEVPSIQAAEMYLTTLRVIALAGIYDREDIKWVIQRLRQDQSRYDRGPGDWQAYEDIINAIQHAAVE